MNRNLSIKVLLVVLLLVGLFAVVALSAAQVSAKGQVGYTYLSSGFGAGGTDFGPIEFYDVKTRQKIKIDSKKIIKTTLVTK